MNCGLFDQLCGYSCHLWLEFVFNKFSLNPICICNAYAGLEIDLFSTFYPI